MDDWSFDVFGLNEAGENHSLKYIGYELLQRYDVITKFKVQTPILEAFLLKLEEGYSKHKNPYHNLVHAADVCQTTHHIMSQSGLAVSIFPSSTLDPGDPSPSPSPSPLPKYS